MKDYSKEFGHDPNEDCSSSHGFKDALEESDELKVDLSEEALRKRLQSAVACMGDFRLQDATINGCIDSIAFRIAKSQNTAPIIIHFFKDLPDGPDTIRHILNFKYNSDALTGMIQNIGNSLWWTKDYSEVINVAKILDQEKVHTLVNYYCEDDFGGYSSKLLGLFMQHLGLKAHWSQESRAVEHLTDLFCSDPIYSSAKSFYGESFDVVMDSLVKIAYWTYSLEALSLVSETANKLFRAPKSYSGLLLKTVMHTLGKASMYSKQYDSVNHVAASLDQEIVLKVLEKYLVQPEPKQDDITDNLLDKQQDTQLDTRPESFRKTGPVYARAEEIFGYIAEIAFWAKNSESVKLASRVALKFEYDQTKEALTNLVQRVRNNVESMDERAKNYILLFPDC